ncbi:MAG: ABC transporter permease subunit [Acidobacteria bacterium]|nr:ABC transporter permease subunit [Acidobacteriota bacterium]
MRKTWVIAHKEMQHGMNTLMLYVFAIAMLVSVSYTVFWSFAPTNVFLNKSADVRPMMSLFPYIFMVFVPAIAMRCWSEERRLGTLELLLSYPFSARHLVLGKFIGQLIPIWLTLTCTLIVPLLIDQIGDPDWGPVWGGYAGALFLSAACLAISMCIGSLTQHQIAAFIASFACLAFLCLFFVSEGNLQWRFSSIARGLIDTRDLVYFAVITCGFLALNIRIIDSQFWRS